MAKKQKVPKGHLPIQAMLGTAVRTHRRQMGITQEELAWRADMHRTYLADIERGVRNVTLRSVANLAKALEMSVEGLLFRSSGAGGVLSADPEATGLSEVLLVEDNPQEVELTLRTFRHAMFSNRVKVVRDGEEALHYLFCSGPYTRRSGGPPQLVLLDSELPNVSGVDVLRQMRTRKSTHDIPVVMLTASRQDAGIAECIRLGASSYIVKPLEFESFARATAKLNFHWAMLPPSAASLPPA